MPRTDELVQRHEGEYAAATAVTCRPSARRSTGGRSPLRIAATSIACSSPMLSPAGGDASATNGDRSMQHRSVERRAGESARRLQVTAVAAAVLSLMPLDQFVPCAAFHMQVVDKCGRPMPIFDEFRALLRKYEPKIGENSKASSALHLRARKNCFAVVATGERGSTAT